MVPDRRQPAIWVFSIFLVSASGARELPPLHTADVLQALATRSAEYRRLAPTAAGALVFPAVTRANASAGYASGEGALQVGRQFVARYSIAAPVLGLGVGSDESAVVILFSSPAALESDDNGFTERIASDIHGFVTYHLSGSVDTLKGAKVTLLSRNDP